ncbi:MAG: M28 family peptidase [Bacteroidales bacterium]|nr:M28 family peptidase [Bacteroidales bacterium]
MQKILIKIMVAIFAIIPFLSFSQNNEVSERIIAIAKTDNQTMKHLDVLCNRFGGRPIGSNAYDNAFDWAKMKFEEWGLKVIVDTVGYLPVGFNRGPWFGKMLGEEGMTLHFATPSYTSGTKGKQIGHVVIEPQNQAEFDRMKGKLKGAWVLIDGESKGWPIDFSENADKYRDSIKQVNAEIELKNREIRRQNWQNRKGEQKELLPMVEEPALFYKEMREAGILGIIQSAPVPITALYDRKNLMDLKFETLPETPDIKLDEHQYKKIRQLVKERRDVFLEFDIRNHFRLGPVPYCNLIGVIEGTELPDEYVIMSGHLDSYDVATGGVDDGSGVTPVMEAARLIMKAEGKPKRTILAILWTGEEFGLLGSQSWVDRNGDKLKKISNVFNRDGGPLASAGISVPSSMIEDMKVICAPLDNFNAEIKFEIEKREPMKRPKEAWGSDSGPFAVAGVPVISLNDKDVFGYDFQYREIWHTERDLYNKSIPVYQEYSAVAMAVVVFGVANMNYLIPVNEFYLPTSSNNNKK